MRDHVAGGVDRPSERVGSLGPPLVLPETLAQLAQGCPREHGDIEQADNGGVVLLRGPQAHDGSVTRTAPTFRNARQHLAVGVVGGLGRLERPVGRPDQLVVSLILQCECGLAEEHVDSEGHEIVSDHVFELASHLSRPPPRAGGVQSERARRNELQPEPFVVDLVGALQDLLRPEAAGVAAPGPPVVGQRQVQPSHGCDPVVFEHAFEDRLEVVEFGMETLDPLGLIARIDSREPTLRRTTGSTPRDARATNRLPPTRRGDPARTVASVSSWRYRPVPLVGTVATIDLSISRSTRSIDIEVVDSVTGDDRLGRSQIEGAAKHGEAGEDGFLVVVEQVMGPLHRGPQGLMPLPPPTPATREQPEPLVEPGEDVGRHHRP